MAYRVKGDAVTVHKALSELRNPATNRLEGYDTVGAVYTKGAVIHDNDVSPVIRALVDAGDPHTSELLEYVEDEEVNTLLGERTPEEQAAYDLAAQEARLGPYPLETGFTGPHSSPGIIDPAAAAEKSKLQAERGQVVDPDAPLEEAKDEAKEEKKAAPAKKAPAAKAKADDEDADK